MEWTHSHVQLPSAHLLFTRVLSLTNKLSKESFFCSYHCCEELAGAGSRVWKAHTCSLKKRPTWVQGPSLNTPEDLRPADERSRFGEVPQDCIRVGFRGAAEARAKGYERTWKGKCQLLDLSLYWCTYYTGVSATGRPGKAYRKARSRPKFRVWNCPLAHLWDVSRHLWSSAKRLALPTALRTR